MIAKKVLFVLLAFGVNFAVYLSDAAAQVSSAYASPDKDRIIVNFAAPVTDFDPHASPLISYENENGFLVQIWATVRQSSFLTNLTLELVELRDAKIGGNKVNLLTGSPIVSPVPDNKTRTYSIVIKGVKLLGQAMAAPISLTVDVGRTDKPQLGVSVRNDTVGTGNRREIRVRPQGIAAKDLLAAVANAPGKVEISYELAADDPAANQKTVAESVKGDAFDGQGNPNILSIRPQVPLPRRPKKYKVRVKIPKALVAHLNLPGFDLLAEEDSVSGVFPAAEFVPSKLDRAISEFYFETGFTSTARPGAKDRTNVGNFSLRLRPRVPLISKNVGGDGDGNPIWLETRLLFDADVDTQPLSKSRSPNRVVLGADLDWGKDFFLAGKAPLVPQLIWTNGVRYDSDRDFKLQTLYWRTELTPKFRNFEQSRAFRLFNFKPHGNAKEPTISTYYVRPSFGYELGGVGRRDFRNNPFPTDNISRLFVRWESAIEFKRLLVFSFDNNYYYLQNATNRRHRNYLETRAELNLGPFFTVDLARANQALVFKFQRGEQPPTFGPVNAFSLGFKVSR